MPENVLETVIGRAAGSAIIRSISMATLGRWIYRVLISLYTSRRTTRAVQIAGALGVNYAIRQVSPTSTVAGDITAMLVAIFITFGLMRVPLSLVAHVVQVKRAFEVHLNASMARDLARRTNGDTLGRVLPEMEAAIESAKASRSSIHFMTPCATYLFAKELRKENFSASPIANEQTSVKRSLKQIGDSNFFAKLSAHPGPLHLIVPDHRFRTVAGVQQRELEKCFPPSVAERVQRHAHRIVKSLLKARKRQKLPTEVHRMYSVPSFRLLLADDVCFVQDFPFTTEDGVRPVRKSSYGQGGHAFARAIVSALEARLDISVGAPPRPTLRQVLREAVAKGLEILYGGGRGKSGGQTG